MNRKNKIAFLFGSGVSIPAGIPSTNDISKTLYVGKDLNTGQDISRHTSRNYYIGKPLYHHMGLQDDYVPGILKFLNLIGVEVNKYYDQFQFKLSTSYEDVYYICKQIDDSLCGEYENPAIQKFINKVERDIEVRGLFNDKKYEKLDNLPLSEIATESINYIHDIVCRLLSRKANNLNYLDFIIDAFRDTTVDGIDLFTINHDKVIESYLKDRNVDYIDGFTNFNKHLRVWNPTVYLHSKKEKIKIYKLHGSIDWYRFRPTGGDWHDEFYGIPTSLGNSLLVDEKANLVFDHKNRMIEAIEYRPTILIGTTNKILNYTSSVYAGVFCHAKSSLQDINKLIVSGYGFGDRGINTMIIEWIYSSSDNKILLIHNNPLKLFKTSRGSIKNKWNDWRKNNRLLFINKKIENVSWSEMKIKLFI